MNFFKNPGLTIAGAFLGLGAISCQAIEDWKPTETSRDATAARSQETASTTDASARTSASRSSSTTKGAITSSRMAYPTGDERTSALIVEKRVPNQVRMGQVFEVETIVTNVSGMTLENIVVTEDVAKNFTQKSSSPKAVAAGEGRLRWMIGELEPKESRTIRMTGTAGSTEPITSCISVDYASALCSSIAVVDPKLMLVATGPEQSLLCDEIVYGYVVSNPGSGMAENVVVRGQLPAGLTTGTSATFQKQIGSIEPGASKKFSVKAKAGRTGRFAHSATATAAGDIEAASKEVATTVVAPKLGISMTGPETMFAGRRTEYQITVQNTGNGVARDLVVRDVLPSGTTVSTISDNGKLDGRTITWKLGNLAPNAKRTVSVKLTGTQMGRITSRATANAFCADAVEASATTEMKGIPAILLEVVDVEDPIEVGANETYIVTVTNQGTAPATNVGISIELPANTTFVRASGATQLSAGAGSRRITLAPVRSLAPKAEAAWQIVVRGDRAADARFKVSMTSDQLTSPVEEAEATTFYE